MSSGSPHTSIPSIQRHQLRSQMLCHFWNNGINCIVRDPITSGTTSSTLCREALYHFWNNQQQGKKRKKSIARQLQAEALQSVASKLPTNMSSLRRLVDGVVSLVCRLPQIHALFPENLERVTWPFHCCTVRRSGTQATEHQWRQSAQNHLILHIILLFLPAIIYDERRRRRKRKRKEGRKEEII